MSLEKIILIKGILCVCNVIAGFIGLIHEEVFSKHLVVNILMLLILLSPIFIWNRWLYEGMFESEQSRMIISYKGFQVIGLLMALMVFLSMTLAYDWNAHAVI